MSTLELIFCIIRLFFALLLSATAIGCFIGVTASIVMNTYHLAQNTFLWGEMFAIALCLICIIIAFIMAHDFF